MDQIAHLGVVWARAIDVGEDIIEKIDETNENKTEIKRLKQECRGGSGCHNDVKKRLEDLDLISIKILDILKNFKKELPKRLGNVNKYKNTGKEMIEFNEWVSHYEKKIAAEQEIYDQKHEKMAEILGHIPEDDIPYDGSSDPITPLPSSPINWTRATLSIFSDVVGEGHKRKKTRRRRRKTKAKKKKRKRKTKRKRKGKGGRK